LLTNGDDRWPWKRRENEVRKGSTMPPEHRQKISAALTGKRYSEAHRAAIAEGMRRYRAEQRRQRLEEESETRGVTG
jgi:hypothetical protein